MLGAGLATYFSVDAIGRFLVKSSQLARDFEEVNLQFRRMPQNIYLLERLREATSGTVSDLDLMKLALQAKNFQIPLNLLAKGLEFAKLRADETGDSVDSMFDAFLKGVAKESTKSLTTLGISAKEFKEQVRLSGDYGIALGTIMERELAKTDRAFISSQDKIDKFNAKLENTQSALGKKLAPIVMHLESELLDFLTQMEKFFNLDTPITETQKWGQFLMTTYGKVIKDKKIIVPLTEKELLIEQRKLEAIKKQNAEYDMQITRASRKLQARGYEDALGGGVALEPMMQFYDLQKLMIDEVTDYELAALFLRSDAAQQTFGDMAGAMMNFYSMAGEGSRTFFDMYKIFAAGEAAIASYDAATKVFAATAFMYPFNYVAAGAALTFGLSNVARILSMQPGSAPSGGGGTTPSIPRGDTINSNNRNAKYYITVNTQGGFQGDPDKFAREILYHLEKARNDGGG